MKETVAINGLTLCHKKSTGWVRSTLPDVCRAPTTPVPFVNVAYAKDLAKGTRTVRSHKGAMNGVKGAEFSVSTGDEPGKGGGIKSGVNMHRATFLSWSPNVFMEGRPVTRLTDRMLLNKGNTISAGGYFTGPINDEKNREVLDKVCEFSCQCLAEGTMNQRCVAAKLRGWAEEEGRNIVPEAGYSVGPDGKWILRVRPDGSVMRNGQRRPDVTDLENNSIIENKLSNPNTGYKDRYQPGQSEDYDAIVQDNEGMVREDVDFDDCDCDGQGRTKEQRAQEQAESEKGLIPAISRALMRLMRGPPLIIPPGLLQQFHPRPGVPSIA